jgi:hypothetical protein
MMVWLTVLGRVMLAALLLATGCTSVLGVTDPPTNTCGGATATGECSLCLYASCCAQVEACAQNTDCVDGLFSCTDGCDSGDSSCLNQCASSYSSTTIDEYNDLVTCTNTSCPSSC